jgi:hypothetical protein
MSTLEPTLGEIELMGGLDAATLAALDATHGPGWRDRTRTELAREAGGGELTAASIALYLPLFGWEWAAQATYERFADDPSE